MMDKMNESVVNSVIDALAKAIGTLKTQSANIDEEFRKKLEEAKKALNEQIEETTNQYHYWLAVRGDVPMPEKKPRKKREKKEEVPAPPKDIDKVVDTIFPENNEPEDMPEEEIPEEKPAEEIKEEASLNDIFSNPIEEPVEETPAEEPIEEDPFGEETTPMNLDDWDELEEWKEN